MDELEHIYECMSFCFLNITQENYVELYNHLLDISDGNHNPTSDLLIKQECCSQYTLSHLANIISNLLSLEIHDLTIQKLQEVE